VSRFRKLMAPFTLALSIAGVIVVMLFWNLMTLLWY
jgi:hypothetical protein